jgi:hypothetical protein
MKDTENKATNMKILKALEIRRLFRGKNLNIRINERLTDYDSISILFDLCKIRFNAQNPIRLILSKKLKLHIGTQIK